MNNHLKKYMLGLLLVASSQSLLAQWTIKESELPGSNLETMIKERPYLIQVVPDDEWNASNYASQEDLQWFKEAKYGMFISFGLSTYVNKELSWGIISDRVLPDGSSKQKMYPREEWTSWADSMRLENFSKENLVRIIKESGVKYMVVIAKHHDGFHLWDTQYSDFKSTNSPYKKDFIREVVDACHAAGIKVGIYYSQRDWYHPDYQPVDLETAEHISTPPYFRAKEGKTVKPGKRHHKYLEYQFNVVRELCTNYGKIDIFWFDACYWGGMFTPDMWDAERLTRMIRELQPGILINNRASLPGDFDTPEQRIGMFQNRRPWETCMTLCGGWSYTPSPVKSPLTIFQKLQSTAIGDGNLLLSWGMKWDGAWDEKQEASFVGVGNYLKKYGHAIYSTQGGPWLPKDWGGTTFKNNKVYVHIVKAPESGQVLLPELAGFKVLQSKDISGHSLSLERVDGGYMINTKTLGKIESPVIMELTVDKSLTTADVEIPEKNKNDMGNILSTRQITTGKMLQIELANIKSVKNLKLESGGVLTGNVVLSFSKDGKQWEKPAPVALSGKTSIIPVTSYVAGALLDGKEAQFIKIELSQNVKSPISCSVYGE